MTLKARWNGLCKCIGVTDEISTQWWEFIETHYEEPTRFYHKFTHLEELFKYRDQFAAQLSDKDSVDLAIWFHDVIYNPKSKTNEEESAKVFEAFANQCNLNETKKVKVYDWIVATKDHQADHLDDDGKLFLDMDMAILGSKWPEYFTYTKLVREEYIHYSNLLWCIGRGMFVTKTLGSKQIFHTKFFHDQFEHEARTNMIKEFTQIQNDLASGLCPKWLSFLVLAVVQLNVRNSLGLLLLNTFLFFGMNFIVQSIFISIVLIFMINCCVLLLLLLRSTIIHYPYLQKKQLGAIVQAGSFNPPHKGHLDITHHLSKTYEKVYVVIGSNPSKTYAVSPEKRKELYEELITNLNLKNVEVCCWTDLIWRFAHVKDAQYLARGFRSWKADGLDELFLAILNAVFPWLIGGITPFPTVYLQANPSYVQISSSSIRKKLKNGESVSDLTDVRFSDVYK